MPGLFGFPDPVNETSARVVAGGVVAMAGATVALDQPWLLVPLTYGFAARVMSGPRFSPLGLLATRVVTPRLDVEHRFVPGPPKRLAQGFGLAFCLASLIAYKGLGRKRLAYGILSGLIAAASLEAFAGYCVACRLFPVLVKAGIVPASSCEECADLSRRAAAA